MVMVVTLTLPPYCVSRNNANVLNTKTTSRNLYISTNQVESGQITYYHPSSKRCQYERSYVSEVWKDYCSHRKPFHRDMENIDVEVSPEKVPWVSLRSCVFLFRVTLQTCGTVSQYVCVNRIYHIGQREIMTYVENKRCKLSLHMLLRLCYFSCVVNERVLPLWRVLVYL